MANTDLPNAKIIILFILSKVSGISSSQLMDCAMESLYMDYFLYSQAKTELLDQRLMTEGERKGELRKDASGKTVLSCDITPAGSEILTRLLPSVPAGIRAYLTSASRNWQHDTNESQSVYAEYAPNDEGTWYVDLRLIERGSTTFALHMAAPSEEVAERTCKRWESATAETYMEILRLLSEEK
ncbi:MAG: DUF4364 family protein [Clostridiales bacterium]|nr:DUF4364 family protein [Clostridiales bacterium]MBQ5967915.1 DUF4364 family protein [Clostridiales bacterium]MBQ6272181.1 DUF4364 family protein [Clostridiales bacterium]MCR5058022.1 DUF4364 family protein [Clostridiales bacterium]